MSTEGELFGVSGSAGFFSSFFARLCPARSPYRVPIVFPHLPMSQFCPSPKKCVMATSFSPSPKKRSPQPLEILEERGYRFVKGISRRSMMEAIDAGRREELLDAMHNGQKDFEWEWAKKDSGPQGTTLVGVLCAAVAPPNQTEPEHGKSDCDGLGAGIKTMLWQWFAQCEVKPNPEECVDYLWQHTKGVPIRGKYSKYKEYGFKLLQGTAPTTKTAQTIVGITKRYHWASVGRPGAVDYRTLPCFCDLCHAHKYDLCKNKAFVGDWTRVQVAQK